MIKFQVVWIISKSNRERKEEGHFSSILILSFSVLVIYNMMLGTFSLLI